MIDLIWDKTCPLWSSRSSTHMQPPNLFFFEDREDARWHAYKGGLNLPNFKAIRFVTFFSNSEENLLEWTCIKNNQMTLENQNKNNMSCCITQFCLLILCQLIQLLLKPIKPKVYFLPYIPPREWSKQGLHISVECKIR